MPSWIFTISVLAGFIFSKIFSGRRAGEQGIIKSIRIRIRRHRIHLHHWIWCLLAIGTMAWLNYSNLVLTGMLSGGLIQGLTYRDFYKIVMAGE